MRGETPALPHPEQNGDEATPPITALPVTTADQPDGKGLGVADEAGGGPALHRPERAGAQGSTPAATTVQPNGPASAPDTAQTADRAQPPDPAHPLASTPHATDVGALQAASQGPATTPPQAPQPTVSLAAAPAPALVPASPGSAASSSVDPTHAGIATPMTPAAQAIPAVVTLASQNGTHSISLRLTPDELGSLHVHIERAASGATAVSLAADRADTLNLVMRDAAQLHRALDAAGVPSEGRRLSFHLVPALASDPTTGAGAQGSPTGAESGWVRQGESSGTSLGGRGPGGGHGRGRLVGGAHDTQRSDGSAPPDDTVAARWFRPGINITA
ncbi:MAG: flagellar hook-length control protein FliK [Acetobacteraceae bacterium]|nr:flagellar hook-length control protein FliK [Acetobacteraceae bacterium]